MTNRTAMAPTPALATPVSWATAPTSMVPMKEAPFPQMS